MQRGALIDSPNAAYFGSDRGFRLLFGGTTALHADTDS